MCRKNTQKFFPSLVFIKKENHTSPIYAAFLGLLPLGVFRVYNWIYFGSLSEPTPNNARFQLKRPERMRGQFMVQEVHFKKLSLFRFSESAHVLKTDQHKGNKTLTGHLTSL